MKKKKARILLWPASSPSMCWHMKEACKVERISSVNGRPCICWRTEVKVAPSKVPEWLWMVSQRRRRPLLALQTGYCSFRRISGSFLCKIEGQGNKFHLLRSLLSHFIKTWWQPNMQHWLPHLAPDAVPRITTNIWRWAHGEKDKNVRAIRPWMKNHNSTTSCLRSELSELQIDPS